MTGNCSSGQFTFRYSDSVRINYEACGSGSLPVVFLHGFAAALSTWDDIRGLLPTDRYRLYFLDLKGFGRSSRPRDGAYRPADQARVLSAFLEAEGLQNVVLVGHSLGGGIALLACLEARSRGKDALIGGLVLIDSAAYLRKLPPVFRLLRVPPLGWAILNLLPVSLMVRYVLFRIYYDARSVTPARIARYTSIYDKKESTHVLTGSVRQLIPENFAEVVASYRQIALPVLIVWGENDPIIRVEDGHRLRSDIPGSRLVVFGQCGHNPHEEKPGETVAAITEFLDNFFLIRTLK
jgi:pimeloyl-ACP methyl ester carboxylesterase